MIKTTAQKIYLGLIFIFLYAPIITLIVLSFNASKTRAKWGGFTTKWYAALFRNEQIMQALWNTLALAILSALIDIFNNSADGTALTCRTPAFDQHQHRELMLLDLHLES